MRTSSAGQDQRIGQRLLRGRTRWDLHCGGRDPRAAYLAQPSESTLRPNHALRTSRLKVTCRYAAAFRPNEGGATARSPQMRAFGLWQSPARARFQDLRTFSGWMGSGHLAYSNRMDLDADGAS
jgi:hypothetical protein